MKKVKIYTDGACSGNPGPGGWAGIIVYNGVEKEVSGGEVDTTNNRMELLAAIKTLEALKEPCSIDLYTDSKYVKTGISEWIDSWKNRNWKGSNKKDIKNVDLWKELDMVRESHEIKWHWVKGHSGNHFNEKVDQIAVKMRDKYKK
ncbi:MAG: ribonuclease HI [Alphaproteobacteria bacterium]|nr:ribonuclease HI [Alphaproteobacteria bacterium]